MTLFEMIYASLRFFLPALHRQVYLHSLQIVGNLDSIPKILDIGGRKSHYTIGIPGEITITDVPRISPLQHELYLGIDTKIEQQLLSRRSNIQTVLLDDMTQSILPDAFFDYALAVEVLEHVEEDESFITHVHRVLKPGGVFLMTTPNGDYKKNTNPDHKRHYKKDELQFLLCKKFDSVTVFYAVPTTFLRYYAIKSWSIKRPFTTILSMFSGFISNIKSSNPKIKGQVVGTHHLIAIATKKS